MSSEPAGDPNDRAALEEARFGIDPTMVRPAPYRRIREHAEQCEMEVRDVLQQLAMPPYLAYCGPVTDRYRELDALGGNWTDSLAAGWSMRCGQARCQKWRISAFLQETSRCENPSPRPSWII